ncbi:hypothetical protein GCM10011344_34010 [Dokdonia pacifica]|nr:hypothetical protein GCM10011344_34010 [Dokdonia pacifica]
MCLVTVFSFFSSNPKGWNENFYYLPFRVGKIVEIESNAQWVTIKLFEIYRVQKITKINII